MSGIVRYNGMSVVPPIGGWPNQPPTIIQLGRYGDILNVLPLALSQSVKFKQPIDFVVGREFASILERSSYVNPIIWEGSPDTLPHAINAYQEGRRLLVTQAWLNPDRRQLTKSFSLEQWRYAQALDQKESWPLIFDRGGDVPLAACAENSQVHARSTIHSAASNVAPTFNPKRATILVATTSISTPYPHANQLIAMIRGLDADVIDMDNVKLPNPIDLLNLYNQATCLVTVDTMHTHLSRASYCPVIALINDGWRGAVTPQQTVAAWQYSELGSDLQPVVEAVVAQIRKPKAESVAVVLNTYQPDTDRHKRAMATHPRDAIYFRFHKRPKVKELLQKGLGAEKDIVVFTNDDVSFKLDTIDRILDHASKWNFGCSRRPPEPNIHIGREIFWFRTDWLKDHWNEIPYCYWTVPKPDLILVKWMRSMFGIKTTYENLNYDFAPIEVPSGLIDHEWHPSHWNTPEILNSPETLQNEAIWAAMT